MDIVTSKRIIEQINTKKHIVEQFLGFKDRPSPKIIKKKIESVSKEVPELLDIFYQYKIQDNELNLIYSVGPLFEEKTNEYFESGETMNGMIVDKFGVVALDTLRALVLEEIQEKYNKSAVKFYYPAGKDYGIELQREIWEMLDTGCITINDYDQLYPIKTVALRAELEDGCFKKDASPCESCANPCEFKGVLSE